MHFVYFEVAKIINNPENWKQPEFKGLYEKAKYADEEESELDESIKKVAANRITVEIKNAKR